jgi:hypothetical protein
VEETSWFGLVGLWWLISLSTICQYNCGSQFSWCMKLEKIERLKNQLIYSVTEKLLKVALNTITLIITLY